MLSNHVAKAIAFTLGSMLCVGCGGPEEQSDETADSEREAQGNTRGRSFFGNHGFSVCGPVGCPRRGGGSSSGGSSSGGSSSGGSSSGGGTSWKCISGTAASTCGSGSYAAQVNNWGNCRFGQVYCKSIPSAGRFHHCGYSCPSGTTQFGSAGWGAACDGAQVECTAR